MSEPDLPPGWSSNPSTWPRRLPAFLLALVGLGIATYLALFQLDVFSEVWEPFFGNGSRLLLKQSAIAHLLPIPDAALGAIAYLLDAILDFAGGPTRWRTAPWLFLMFGALAFLLGITGILLVILQPTPFGAFCTLCLCSTACSVLTAIVAADEVLAVIAYLKRETTAGRSFCAFWRAGGVSPLILHPIADGMKNQGAYAPARQTKPSASKGKSAGTFFAVTSNLRPSGPWFSPRT